MIPPTLGRVVWFTNHDGTQEAAMVTHVWHDRLINLVAFDMEGNTRGVINVPLLQDDDQVPTYQKFAQWMPYQIKKHDGGDS